MISNIPLNYAVVGFANVSAGAISRKPERPQNPVFMRRSGQTPDKHFVQFKQNTPM
jgi:hypothetical protein